MYLARRICRFLGSVDSPPDAQSRRRAPSMGPPAKSNQAVVAHLSFNASGRLESVEFHSVGDGEPAVDHASTCGQYRSTATDNHSKTP